jgi:hypothetical protein
MLYSISVVIGSNSALVELSMAGRRGITSVWEGEWAYALSMHPLIHNDIVPVEHGVEDGLLVGRLIVIHHRPIPLFLPSSHRIVVPAIGPAVPFMDNSGYGAPVGA